jgi:flagellar FliL protein
MSDASAGAPEGAAKEGDRQAASGGKNTLLIVIVAVVLALGAGGGGMWFFMSKDHGDDEEITADSGEEHEADSREEKGKSRDRKGKKGKAQPKLPALYVKYEPPFVVNFDAKGVMRFLQVSMEAMTRDARTEELIKSNEPKIRNNMLLLLGSQTYETIATMEGKEELRRKALGIIAKVVEDEGGEGKKVEDIYFTSFVMQ